MTHHYTIEGITCSGCEAKVKSSLLVLPYITAVDINATQQLATITMDKHVSVGALQQALDKKYTITAAGHSETAEVTKNWLATYKPVLLIVAYITGIAIIAAVKTPHFDLPKAMNVFMAGFFLSFSFFKLLDVKGFAESYVMYDVVAKKVKAWAFVYPFIELTLGIAYAAGVYPIWVNIIAFCVMAISIAGVLQSILNKQKIQCACLGAVFNLPMSTVTIIEDALMIAMSGIMIVHLL